MTDKPSKRSRPKLRSLLTPALERTLAGTAILAALMLANTVYLLLNRLADALDWQFFAVGDISLPKFFQGMVLTHTGIGVLLFILMLAFAITHLTKVWKRAHRSSVISGIAYLVAGSLLLITGLFILTDAASRDNRWAWWMHVVCAGLVPAGYAAHRLVSYVKPASGKFRKFSFSLAALVIVLVTMHSFSKRDILRTEEAQLAIEQGLDSGPGARDRDVTEFLDSPFVPVGFVPPGSPFFPSPATTSSGGYLPSRIITRGELGSSESLQNDLANYGFANETLIGSETCDRCHQDIVAQWATSAHRFASFNNPFYEATIQSLRTESNVSNRWIAEHTKHFPETTDRTGMVKSKWCSGCHDPALMLAGKMDAPIDRATPQAQAGLTCLACHAIDRIHDQTGNGNYNIADEQEDPYLFAKAGPGSIAALLHDAILKAKPTVHKRKLLKPFFRQSSFCATCHKVSLTVPVNNYRWFRGQNEFDNWHDSGVALNASRTFYLPGQKRECQDCHMPLEPAPLGDIAAKDGKVRSHRFIAVNTALPFIRGDQETIERIEAFLQDEKLSVDIFALKIGQTKERFMAVDQSTPTLPLGEKVTVDVVVRNKGVGHTFPGGTNDSNEGWLEFSLQAADGTLLAISGKIGKDGHLDPAAHVYKAVILDKNGDPIDKRNAQDIHVTVFANVIGPGTADIAHYEFTVPPELKGQSITLSARLLWRKFDRVYTEFAFRANPEGFKQFDQTPDLPITEIAADELTIAVGREQRVRAANGIDGSENQWIRFNDYGIGLLLEGNTRGASKAFEQVTKLQPDLIEGYLNLAKTAVRDGNIDKAYVYLQQCESRSPGDARVAWAWGLALQEDGQYEKAASANKRVLEKFPEDRVTWRNLGRTYYLDQKYESALQAFAKVLEIDPEDRTSHYHRMLCFRALGREQDARIAEAAYEYYQIDESAQEITRAYKLRNPGANLMSQQIRTHVLQLIIN